MTAKKPVPAKGPSVSTPVKAVKTPVDVQKKSAKPAVKPGAVAVEALKGKAGRKPGKIDDKARFRLPELDRSWETTLDTLRPGRPREESFYDWRKRSPLPVTFSPTARLSGDVEQLHLAHPFTKRILDRFLNLLPTVTIREGHRIKVYLSGDVELPAYRDPLRLTGGRP